MIRRRLRSRRSRLLAILTIRGRPESKHADGRGTYHRKTRESHLDQGPRFLRARFVVELRDETHNTRHACVAIERKRGPQRAPLLRVEIGRTLRLEVRIASLRRRQSIKRVVARQQLVGDAAERIDVVARVRLAMLNHLWTRIRGRQRAETAGVEDSCIALLLRPLKHAGNAEVDHLHFGIRREKDVGGLEIAMHETVLMRIGERIAHAAHNRQRGANRHALIARRAQ